MRLLMRLLMLLMIGGDQWFTFGGCTVEFLPGRSVRSSVQSAPPLISDSFTALLPWVSLVTKHLFEACWAGNTALEGCPSGVLRLTGSLPEDAPGLCPMDRIKEEHAPLAVLPIWDGSVLPPTRKESARCR